MGLKCGIVGLPNVGKSTLFNCLTDARAQTANFPFCTIEPNVGMINVPDDRLNRLADIIRPQRVVPATIEIVDIAGLVKGASQGEGLGNQFLAHIRETHAILHLLRCFDDDNVVHVDGAVDPVRDKETVDTELMIKDLETVEKKIQRMERIAHAGGDRQTRKSLEVAMHYRQHLAAGHPARTLELSDDERQLMTDCYLLTEKPVLYICNVDEQSVLTGNRHVDRVRQAVAGENAEILIISAAAEAEIARLDSPEERQMFLNELGLTEPGTIRLIRAAYQLLNLQTFFTITGKKEVRAWTFRKGMTAIQTAGLIHSDFEKGFIRAEVIRTDDFLQYKSETACRENGKIAIEGKDYAVQDGDILRFRFNV
jgi:GTP-binding protein YchF